MPYGRRRRRRYSRRPIRRRKYRRLSRGRKKVSSKFKGIPRRIKRQAKLACPVVYECLKKIAIRNKTYCLKTCAGLKTTSIVKFALAGAANMTVSQGPFSAGTGEDAETCGYFSAGNVYNVPTAFAEGNGLSLVDHHPASVEYRNTPFDFQVFPLLAMANPTVADARFNENNCRVAHSCNIISWDNRHHIRIEWPTIDQAGAGLADAARDQYLMMHEVVWWVPDLTTVTGNALVAVVPASAAAAQVSSRLQRTWTRQMYNAYFVKHPIADASITDVIDYTAGSTANASNTFNEPLVDSAPATEIGDDNMLPQFRDELQYLAAGIEDRKKDGKPFWNRKRYYRRPRGNLTGNNVNTSTSAQTVSLPQVSKIISAGRKFNINKSMEWDRTTPDATPDSAVREVCPRGCYVYVKYWYYANNFRSSTAIPTATPIHPNLSMAFVGKVDKTHILIWNNT